MQNFYLPCVKAGCLYTPIQHEAFGLQYEGFGV